METTTEYIVATGSAIISPTAGTHTYKLTLHKEAGGGSVTLAASSTYPSFILVEDITGSVWPTGSAVTAGMVASEAWTPWTPTFTNVTVGNGTLVAAYMKIGRTVHYRLRLVLGSTSSVGTDPQFALPFAIFSGFSIIDVVGEGSLADSGTANWRAQVWLDASGRGRVVYYSAAATAVQVSPTVPFTWTTGDAIVVTGTYEAAS
jgi:hypothetical protein